MKTKPTITVKSGAEFQEVVEFAYATDSPLMAVGGTGIAKSAMFRAAAVKMKIGCVVRDLTTLEAIDLSGIPQPDGERVKYLLPDYLPREGPALLVFEEMNRAPRYVLAPCLELLTARALNNYKLPDGCLPVAAVNPPNEDFHVDELDPALLARFMIVHVVPSEKEWLSWAAEHAHHKAVLGFVRSQPEIFSAPKSNPRAWSRISALAKEFESGEYGRLTLLVAVAGFVGEDLAHAFIEFMGSGGLPLEPNEILKAYADHRAKVRSWKAEGNTALIDSSCKQLVIFLQDQTENQRVAKSPAKLRNLNCFFEDLPGEFRAVLTKHQPALLKGVPNGKR